MSRKLKLIIAVALAVQLLGDGLYYVLVTRHKKKEITAWLRSLKLKHYKMTVLVQVDINKLPQSAVLRKIALNRIDSTLQLRIHMENATLNSRELNMDKGSISYTLSSVVDTNSLLSKLSHQGKLEFYQTYEMSELLGCLQQINNRLKETVQRPTLKKHPSEKAHGTPSAGDRLFGNLIPDSLKIENAVNQQKEDSSFNPFYDVFYPNIEYKGLAAAGPLLGWSSLNDTAAVNAYLSDTGIRALLPHDLKLMWGAYAVGKSKSLLGLYAIQRPEEWEEAPLTGKYIRDAFSSFSNDGIPDIELSFNVGGSYIWELMTREAFTAKVNGRKVKKCIAIVLDGKVYSAPRVLQTILYGKSEITGINDKQEADDLADMIKSGEIELPISISYYSTK